MNIKSIAGQLLPFEVRKIKKETRSEASTERDANGQNEGQQEGRQPRRNLSENEIQAAISYLKELPGVKDNNLQVRLISANNVPVVLIEDIKGKVVRRIPESELSMLPVGQEPRQKGNLINKSM